MPFGLWVYGFYVTDAYGYTGGVCLSKSVVGSTVSATPKTRTNQITSPATVQAMVTDSTGQPVGGIGVAFNVTGINPQTGYATTNSSGVAVFSYTSLKTGSDLITATAGSASDTAGVTWVSNGPNQPPVVNAGPNQAISLPTNSVTLIGSVVDDGLPIGGTLTATWTQLSGPAPATIGSPNQAITSVTLPQVGTYVFQLTGNDSQLSTSATVSVVLSPANQPPVVNAGPNQTYLWLTGSVSPQTLTLSGSAADDGLPAGSTLAVSWKALSGAGVTFGSPNSPVTQVTFTGPGTYAFQLSASDGQFTSTSITTVTVYGPLVITPSTPSTVVAGSAVQLQSTVTVGGYPVSSPLVLQWANSNTVPAQVSFVTPNSPNTIATFPSVPGTYDLTLTVSDPQVPNDGSTVYVRIIVLAPGTIPTVSLNISLDGSVIKTPTPITGSVDSGNWTLDYALKDDVNPMTFTTLATGTSAVTNGTLGTLDPTMLLNGTYLVRLTSVNSSGQANSTSETVTVVGNAKAGVFSLSLNDLTVPVAGIPIQVVRSYDSRDKRQGDFGVGWHLSLANIRAQKTRNLGLNWEETQTQSGYFPQYCLFALDNKVVNITFPDGRVFSFQTGSNQQCEIFQQFTTGNLSFTELPGPANTAGATLTTADAGGYVIDGTVPGPVTLVGLDGNPYNPTRFILNTADGTSYTVDQQYGLVAVRDVNGNTLTISPAGISSSTGKSVPFARDDSGRVTSISDFNGNTLKYSYDANGNLTASQDRNGNNTVYAYDNGHNLLTIKTPDGTQALTNNFDSSGRLTYSRDALGYQVSFTNNVAAQTQTITDRNGNPTTYAYDQDGNITQVTDALNNITTSTYDANDNKLSETNALGKTTNYTYDTLGNRLTETDPLNHTTTYTYNALSKPLTITDANGHTTTNTYDANGNLLTTTDPLGKATTNTYSSNGLLLTTKDPLGNTTSFTYDGSGNLPTQTDAKGTVTTYTYDANNNRASQSVTRTLAGGTQQTLTTSYAYDPNGKLTKTTYPDGSTTQSIYNNLGQQVTSIDALGRQTTYQYDNDGHISQTTYPDKTSDSVQYDKNGNRVYFFSDRHPVQTFYSYDPLNRLTQTQVVAGPRGAITTTTYDAIGQVLSSKDPNGNVTQYAYDDAGRRTSVTDALNHITSFTYDAVGNQLTMTDANNNTASYVYDAANRRTQVNYVDKSSEATAYDALGRVISRTDAKGFTTQYAYDALGRLTSVTDALNQVTSYSYDEVGNRLTQTDANNHTTRYAYDQRGRRISRTLPMGQTESYTYDAVGNMFTKTDFNGKTTTYAYDTGNRLLSKTPDPSFHAQPVTYTYNFNGQRTGMSDASGNSGYDYDSFGRLQDAGSPAGSLGYSYDKVGNLTHISGVGNGVQYNYDALNRLTSVSNSDTGTTSYTYDNVGNLQSVTYPNGVVHTYTYDNRNRLSTLNVNGTVNGAAGPIAGYTYTVDASGHRTSVAEQSGRTVNYSYDNLYRLTSETIASDPNGVNGAASYVYDPVGNRTQKTSTIPDYPGGLTNYNANDQLSTDTYDANGNTTLSAGQGYVYDFENRLIQAGGVTYTYDGDGNRASKTANGVTTKYLVDTQNPTGYPQVLEEIPSNSFPSYYVYGLEQISRQRQFYNPTLTTETIYYVHDGHGSVRALTDKTGAVTDTYDYDAFGNLIHSTGTTPNNYLFAGEQFDPDLALYYNRARYLNSTEGRFSAMDTDEGNDVDPLSLHKYLFSEADPVNNADPSGHEIDEVIGSLGLANTINALPALNFATFVSVVQPESLYIRAFAPWKTFGLGFGGDDRSFTTSRAKGVTSRVVGIVKFLLASFRVVYADTYSDLSHWGSRTSVGSPSITATSSDGQMHVQVAGSNPLVPFSSDIDVKLDIRGQLIGGQACYSGYLYGDAFPNVEVFVVNHENDATMLDTFATQGGRQTGPYVYLPGNNDRPMGSFSKCTTP